VSEDEQQKLGASKRCRREVGTCTEKEFGSGREYESRCGLVALLHRAWDG